MLRFSTKRILGFFALDLLGTLSVLLISLELRHAIGRLPPAAEELLRTLQIPTGIVWSGAESAALLMPQVLVLVSIIWPIFFFSFSVYDGHHNTTLMSELSNVIVATVASTMALAGILFLTYRETSRGVIILFLFLDLSLLIGVRISWWAYRHIIPRERVGNRQNVVIIGAGEVGQTLRERILKDIDNNINFIGFLDDDLEKKSAHPNDILDGADSIRKVVMQYKVDDVILALPRRAHERTNFLVSELHTLPVKVWVIPDYFALTLHKAKMTDYAGIPMLDLRAPALSERQRTAKVIFDSIVTLVSLPITFPLMILIAIAIKLDSKGSIIFKQERVGENGKTFVMYKFRTMIDNAENLRSQVETFDNNGKLIHKMPDDPRVTRVGRFLRRTSLDELPQLFNVLKGEMSLVGPRPELPYLVEKYEPWQRKRFAVPQGLTGWWQINGRSDKPMHLNTEDDLYYVQNYSLLLDIQILLMTLWAVISGKGAF